MEIMGKLNWRINISRVFYFNLVYLCSTVPAWRKRYVQENAEGLYTGATLLIAYDSISIPFAFISSLLSTCVIYP